MGHCAHLPVLLVISVLVLGHQVPHTFLPPNPPVSLHLRAPKVDTVHCAGFPPPISTNVHLSPKLLVLLLKFSELGLQIQGGPFSVPQTVLCWLMSTRRAPQATRAPLMRVMVLVSIGV